MGLAQTPKHETNKSTITMENKLTLMVDRERKYYHLLLFNIHYSLQVIVEFFYMIY